MKLCCVVFLSFHTNMGNFNTQGIPPGNSHLSQGIPTYIMRLMCFLYPHSQWTRWDACDYWQTPYNRTEWHINTFCCSEPHSFVQCKVRKSSFLGGGKWYEIQNFYKRSECEWLQLLGSLKSSRLFCEVYVNFGWNSTGCKLFFKFIDLHLSSKLSVVKGGHSKNLFVFSLHPWRGNIQLIHSPN